jgi:hypothetical protein
MVAMVRIRFGAKGFASSFRPRPIVDGGLMTIGRRADPLVDAAGRICSR